MSASFEQIQIEGQLIYVVSFRPCKVEIVLSLPPIDEKLQKPRFVYWCDEETGQRLLGQSGGTGDNQVWCWFPGASHYVPLQHMSYHNGVPTQ